MFLFRMVRSHHDMSRIIAKRQKTHVDETLKVFLSKKKKKTFKVSEEDKNKARQAWTDGPDGSISMGQRKDKPIPCVEHYIK